ncbi:hypothetical protein NLY43_11115 [Mesorhizobium sp. C416B]|uniref:hypothetical protein n=1 Tax=unclassified Mesorhizobium TaxID=325217 RepID=UPI0003CE2B77|nr:MULTISPECIES: hypothetical protein [unclassified Mesorhizobium]ESW85020.1 hypothetical protein X770_23030 [Mesorhizobium sp. LSJC269B00]ESX09599.1 hypothetical protein X768_17840 [Mesorhizobium sp. LSJC265A00]ESX45635.1 hypothetical protein X761_31805 [Mesorhizobium sp. LSHC424B00]ESX64558.1 hypothetical protein X758_31370 [Mesorhizobium sp. LSHC416B00]WJI65256.1 hypothetical protein NLY43_11115 [Mesorhizobium sp. C416B]
MTAQLREHGDATPTKRALVTRGSDSIGLAIFRKLSPAKARMADRGARPRQAGNLVQHAAVETLSTDLATSEKEIKFTYPYLHLDKVGGTTTVENPRYH